MPENYLLLNKTNNFSGNNRRRNKASPDLPHTDGNYLLLSCGLKEARLRPVVQTRRLSKIEGLFRIRRRTQTWEMSRFIAPQNHTHVSCVGAVSALCCLYRKTGLPELRHCVCVRVCRNNFDLHAALGTQLKTSWCVDCAVFRLRTKRCPLLRHSWLCYALGSCTVLCCCIVLGTLYRIMLLGYATYDI